MMGFEPTTTGITIQDSTAELHPPLIFLMPKLRLRWYAANKYYELCKDSISSLLASFLQHPYQHPPVASTRFARGACSWLRWYARQDSNLLPPA